MDVSDVIRQAAARYGVDPAPWLHTAQIESGGNPDIAPNAHSGAAGLFQFVPKTWAQYGRGDVNDPAANADAAMRLARDNTARFHSTMGRPPSPGEVYLMHQQGADGATKLLQNPNAPAVSIVGAPAVTQNGGHAGMTAGEFANLWSSKFDGGVTASTPNMGTTASPPPPATGEQNTLRATLAGLAPSAPLPGQQKPQAGVIVGGQLLS